MTVVEVMVTVAISLVLGGVIWSYLRNSQNLITSVSSGQELLAKSIPTENMFLVDLRSASRSSLGDYLLGGDFESGIGDDWPTYWSTSITGNGVFTYLQLTPSTDIYGGFGAVSLQSADGLAVSYTSNTPFTLFPGAAYMVTGWVRSEGAAVNLKIALLTTGGAEVASSVVQSQTWTGVKFRYPPSGTYVNGTLPSNKGKIQLVVSNATQKGFFDTISITPISSVLISPVSAEININSTPNDLADRNDSVGFRFKKWDENKEFLYRFRSKQVGNKTTIKRERYNETALVWEEAPGLNLAEDIVDFRLVYDSSNNLPLLGKEMPLTLSFTLQDDRKTNKANQQFNVFPVAQ